MANNNNSKVKIPGELESAAVDGIVAAASAIYDEVKGKKQSELNTEYSGAVAEIEDIDDRLTQVEELGRITIDGGEAQIATESDFTNPSVAQRAKVPTVGAVLGGMNEGVYDVTSRNHGATFASLSDILNNENLDTLIPTSWRKGGMSIKFVKTSDNKYVQYRYMLQYQNIGGSENLVESGGVFQAIEESKIVDKGLDGDSSLSIIDEEDNCIAQFKDGHIKTKEFDSRESASKDYVDNQITSNVSTAKQEVLSKVAEVDTGTDDTSLSFVDENNECPLQIKGGHIKTKYFDSEEAATTQDLQSLQQKVAEIDAGTSDESVAIVDEEENGIVEFKGGHIRTKHFNSAFDRKYGTKLSDFSEFSGDNWTKDGNKTATCSTANKIFKYNNVSYEDCFNLCASVIPIGSTFEVAFGKYFTIAGSMFSIAFDGTNTKVNYYRTKNGGTFDLVHSENCVNVVAASGKKLFLRIEKRTTTNDVYTVTVYDEYGNKDTFDPFYYTDFHGWASPAFKLISGTSVTVGDFSFGYPIRDELDLIIIGHSYVEGNTLPNNKDKKFASLVVNDIGADRCLVLGVGGEKLSDFLLYEDEYCNWFHNAKYALLYFGANDGLDPSADNFNTKVAEFKLNMQKANAKIIAAGIIPVWCTVNWFPAVGQPENDTLNEWIINTFPNVVDVRKVFENSDGTLDDTKFLPDEIHPSIAAHTLLYNVIKAQANYLFNN